MSDEKKASGATLTLKPRAERTDEAADTRRRSGSRARRVEQMARQQGELPAKPSRSRAKPEAPDAATPRDRGRQDDGRRRGPRAEGPAHSRPDAPERATRARPAGPRPAEARPGNPDRGPRADRSDRQERNGTDRPRVRSADEPRFDRSPRSDRPRSDAPRSPERSRSDAPRYPDRPRSDTPRYAEQARADAQRRARPVTREIVGHDSVFQVFAPCPQGLEAALAEELQAMGHTARAARAGCHLSTDWTGVQRINLYSRLATRVLVKVSSAPVQTEDDILELARATPWERWFGPEHSLRVDTSAVRSPMKSLQYCNLRAKDGICDRLREREGARPDIDTVRPDARVHLFLDETTATLYLDTSGESLFKRGWRLDKGEAPIRENLAAGMLALSGWQPGHALLDPFCGSGTILIEAAWKALGLPPGIMRPFAFERLRHHNRQAWYAYKDQIRDQARTELDAPIVGVDLNPASLEAARLNANRAGLGGGLIQFETGDACTVIPPAPTGWIVTNPPYGERLPTDDPELWANWASHLKRHYSGWQVHAISNDLQLPQRMRLQARRRHPLHNGALDCRLFSFDMVAERYQG